MSTISSRILVGSILAGSVSAAAQHYLLTLTVSISASGLGWPEEPDYCESHELSQQDRYAANGEGSREALPKRKLRSTRSRVLRERVLLPVSPFRFSSSLPSPLFLVPREAKRSVQALSTPISPCRRSTVPRSQPATSGSVTPVSPDNGMTIATIITTAVVSYDLSFPYLSLTF